MGTNLQALGMLISLAKLVESWAIQQSGMYSTGPVWVFDRFNQYYLSLLVDKI